jgi:hypothetical protein
MDKGILAAVIRRNESEALLEIKPLHGSRRHEETLSSNRGCLPAARAPSKSHFQERGVSARRKLLLRKAKSSGRLST